MSYQLSPELINEAAAIRADIFAGFGAQEVEVKSHLGRNLAAGVVAAGLIIAACGSDGNDSEQSLIEQADSTELVAESTTTEAEEVTTTTEAEAEETTPEEKTAE